MSVDEATAETPPRTTVPDAPRFPTRRRGRGLIALGVALAAVAAPGAARADVVTDWNASMLDAQVLAGTPTPPGTRLAAIVQASVFDAVNGIRPRYAPIHVPPAGPEHASRAAAAASAAHEALVALFPAQAPLFDSRFALSLGTVEDDPHSIAEGLAWGKTVADQMLAWRANDGWSAVLPPYVAGTEPGDWAPTPPAFLATPLFRAVGATRPFGLTSLSQFRPPGPPRLDSAAYASDFNEVKTLGSLTSTTRTPAQTLTAQFWQSDGVIPFWNRVALRLLGRHHGSLLREARILALLNVSLADGNMSIFAAKNFFDTWRPITAIRQAGGDGNPATVGDATWQPLVVTPPFQEYPSGHSGTSAAGAWGLASIFGRGRTIYVTSSAYPGLVRTYSGFDAALDDIADARTFSGIHFRFASVDAIWTGKRVGSYLARTLAQPLGDEDRRLHRR